MRTKNLKRNLAIVFAVSLVLVLISMVVMEICTGHSVSALLNNGILGDPNTSSSMPNTSGDQYTADDPRFAEIMGGFKVFFIVMLIVIPAGGTVYAVSIGIKLARADGEESRKEVKKRLVNSIIGLVAVIGLFIILFLYFNNYRVINDYLRQMFGTLHSSNIPQE